MTRPKIQTRVRQQQIVQAALDIVADSGPRALSMANVAGRLGLVPSAIYRHFGSKEAMLLAAIDLVKDKLLENVTLACRASADPMEQLHELMVRHVRMLRENLAIPRVVFSDEVHGGLPKLRAKARGVFRGYLARVAGIVRRGQETGQVRPEADPRAAAMLFMGMIQPAAILWHLSGGRSEVLGQVERSWELYRAALTGGGK
jgi:AcrR family transcriptional regulator